MPLPPDAADQDWQDTIGEIIKTWEATAEYMINKRDTGRSMVNAQETFMNRSVEAIGLPIQLYTLRKLHTEAIAECREITRLGDTWCSEANRFYSLRPDEGRQQRGIVELLQEMELLRDYDCDAVHCKK